ncbi:hypothetical protein BLOT_012353 [Blomia tropicalis]|nr:hypothetical protein BLOT_012353 [Blomia tropicalis]
MEKVVILLLLINYIAAINPQERIGRIINDSEIVSYIYGGQKVKKAEAPWQVAIQIPEFPDFLCGGSIVGNKWVVTSAWCSSGLYATGLQVRSNTLKLSGGTQTAVKATNPNPNYNEEQHTGDISVLELETPLQLGQPNCDKINLPKAGKEPAGGFTVTLTGWGYNSSEVPQHYTEYLQLIELQTVSNKVCKSTITTLADDNACALAQRGKCTSTGDRGGPAARKDQNPPFLYGVIITWDYTCDKEITNTSPYYEVFTYVSKYTEWIKEIMAGGVPTTPGPI